MGSASRDGGQVSGGDPLCLSLCLSLQASQLSQRLSPPPGQRCAGRNYQGRRCCTPEQPCGLGEGDCDGPADGGQHDGHAGCKGDLVCGSNNCKQFGKFYHPKDDCCEKPKNTSAELKAPYDPFKNSIHPTYFRPIDKRCGGRNIDKGICCSQETPCKLGEGDCESDNDCQADLVCGNNNCKEFSAYFHEKDDCCVSPGSSGGTVTILEWGAWLGWSVNSAGERRRLRYQKPRQVVAEITTTTELDPNIPFQPREGQRCAGRNFQGRRCCTPEQPCDEGEGDCDGPADGGQHDGHAGCKGDLVCGNNNCLQFGKFYHPKDDCCEKSKNSSTEQEVPFNPFENSVYPTYFRPIDKRCSGRNIDEGLCCSQETPCDLGEGDCESDNDCQGDLVTAIFQLQR